MRFSELEVGQRFKIWTCLVTYTKTSNSRKGANAEYLSGLRTRLRFSPNAIVELVGQDIKQTNTPEGAT